MQNSNPQKIKKLVGKQTFNHKNLMTMSGFVEIEHNPKTETHIVSEIVLVSFTPNYKYEQSKSMKLNANDLWDIAYFLRAKLNNKNVTYEKKTGNQNPKTLGLCSKENAFFFNFYNDEEFISITINISSIPGAIRQIETLAEETTSVMYKMQRAYEKYDLKNKNKNMKV